MYNINYLAVLASGVIMMILGYVWYGPLFGKPWMKLIGITKSSMEGKGSEMAKNYGMMFVSALVLSYVLAHVLYAFQSDSIGMALQGAFWIWLGFIATTMLSGVIWTKKPLKLYAIEAGYYLVGLGLIGIVLTLWR